MTSSYEDKAAFPSEKQCLHNLTSSQIDKVSLCFGQVYLLHELALLKL